MQTQTAKTIPIIAILEQLGYQPSYTHRGGTEWMYRSPLREESDASFSVNIRKNLFYDFGLGKGGNVIDLAMEMAHATNVSGALNWLKSFENAAAPRMPVLNSKDTNYQIVIEKVQALSDGKLKSYLSHHRKVDPVLAEPYVQEVHYRNGNKGPFYAVGFANDSKGYELRTYGFKGSTSKDLSLIKTPGGNASKVHIFEGFMDFLSLMTLTGRQKLITDVLVLNGTAMQERALETLKNRSYGMIYTWLDNGKGGNALTQAFSKHFPQQVIPMNGIYENHDDLNEYLVAGCKNQTLDQVCRQFQRLSGQHAPRSPYFLSENRGNAQGIRK